MTDTKTDVIVNNLVEKLLSAPRVTLAHFTTYKKRHKSFCLDFKELNAADEYNLASYAYDRSYYIDGLSTDEHKAVVSIGEHIILGAFILAKRDYESAIPTFYDTILDDCLEHFTLTDENREFLLANRQLPYFNDCVTEALRLANK